MQNKLIKILDSFGVSASVYRVTAGIKIDIIEVTVALGTKLAKLRAISEDIARELSVQSVRIAPIPNTNRIGIEIPRYNNDIISGVELLHYNNTGNLSIILGRDTVGNPVCTDLCKTPHLLIAGQTGSGKSVGINTILTSIIATKSPDYVRLILVDPKVVELAMYKDIPHLLHPIVTEPQAAGGILEWVCTEMDNRYNILANSGARNIEGYNTVNGERLPYIVVVVDELADLMMTAGKKIEKTIVRIAQKARAVGIHLILATQRPSTNIITGVIKANLPSRIGFRVSSFVDSRTILDCAGAEKLLGMGDMLFKSANAPEPVRVHGAYFTDAEIQGYIDNAIAAYPAPYPPDKSEPPPETPEQREPAKKSSLKWLIIVCLVAHLFNVCMDLYAGTYNPLDDYHLWIYCWLVIPLLFLPVYLIGNTQWWQDRSYRRAKREVAIVWANGMRVPPPFTVALYEDSLGIIANYEAKYPDKVDNRDFLTPEERQFFRARCAANGWEYREY